MRRRARRHGVWASLGLGPEPWAPVGPVSVQEVYRVQRWGRRPLINPIRIQLDDK